MTTLEIILTVGFVAAILLVIMNAVDTKKLKTKINNLKLVNKTIITDSKIINKICKDSPELIDVLREFSEVYNNAEPCDELTISVCIGPDKDTHITYSVRR